MTSEVDEITKSDSGRRRGYPRAGRAGGSHPQPAQRRRADALPARPLHAGRAGGPRPSLADRPAAGGGSSLPRSRRSRRRFDNHGNARSRSGSTMAPGAIAWPLIARKRRSRVLERQVSSEADRSSYGRSRRPPRRRGSLEGTDGADVARAARGCRASLRTWRALAARTLLERPGRASTGGSPHDIPEYVQDGVVDAGITAPT